MIGKSTAVFCIYPNYSSMENGVAILKDSGFRHTDISVLYSENRDSKVLAHEKATKAPEGAAAGAGTGAVLGGVLGLLTGLGSLAIPGAGPFLAAGPIMAALAGAGAMGAVGGVAGALVGLGMPEYEAKRYQGRITNGGILLSVHSDNEDWMKRAKDIMQRTGAQDIATSGEVSPGSGQSDRPFERRSA